MRRSRLILLLFVGLWVFLIMYFSSTMFSEFDDKINFSNHDELESENDLRRNRHNVGSNVENYLNLKKVSWSRKISSLHLAFK